MTGLVVAGRFCLLRRAGGCDRGELAGEYRAMRSTRTLSLYVARETLQYSVLGFVLITTVLVSQNVLRRVEDMVVVGFTSDDFLVVLGCLTPMLTAYAVPVAFLFGALLAVRRLASDSEVLAMRSCGVGRHPLLIPTVALGALVSALTGYLIIGLEPQARADLRALFTHVAARGSILVPGEFRSVGTRLIFVEDRTRNNELRGVVISDRNDADRPYLLFAERGQFSVDEALSLVRLRLEDGDLHLDTPPGEPESYRRIAFESFDYSFSLAELVGGAVALPTAKEMATSDVREVVRRAKAGDASGLVNEPIEYELQLHRRLALPFAPLLFALIAVPLGTRKSRSGRTWGAFYCALLAFGYYALLSFSQGVARGESIPPALALWAPNGLLGVVAGALLYFDRRGPTA
jgi:lipopolysaccharide export system permease protein